MKIRSLFVMGIAMLAFSACNDELVPEGGVNEGPGAGLDSNEPTYVTIRYSLPGNTRAVGSGTGETGGDNNVTKIQNYQVLIFNATTKSLEHNEVVDLTTAEQDAPPVKKILSTPGDKKMYVLANIKGITAIYNKIKPDVFVPKGEHSTLDSLMKMRYGGTLVTLVPAAGYAMANADSASTFKFLPNITASDNSTSNKFTFHLVNMASIVGVAYKNAATLNVGDIGQISNLKYVLRNIANESFFIQKSPVQGCYYNWAPEGNGKGDASKWAEKFKVPAWGDATSGGIAIAEVPTNTNALFAAKWSLASENVNASPVIGNSTYAAIRGTFTPGRIVDSASWNTLTSKVNLTDIAGTTGETFVRILDNTYADVPVGTFFKDSDLAKEALAMAKYKKAGPNDTEKNEFIEGTHFSTYTGGFCWYRMNIGREDGANTIVGVERGRSYCATINSITGVGQNSEEKLDGSDAGGGNTPDLPLDQNTYLDVTIKAKGWVKTTQTGDLS